MRVGGEVVGVNSVIVVMILPLTLHPGGCDARNVKTILL